MRLPVILPEPCADLRALLSPWAMVTKPNVRPYYAATLRVTSPSDETVEVNLIIDPDDTTISDADLQAKVEKYVDGVLILAHRKLCHAPV